VPSPQGCHGGRHVAIAFFGATSDELCSNNQKARKLHSEAPKQSSNKNQGESKNHPDFANFDVPAAKKTSRTTFRAFSKVAQTESETPVASFRVPSSKFTVARRMLFTTINKFF